MRCGDEGEIGETSHLRVVFLGSRTIRAGRVAVAIVLVEMASPWRRMKLHRSFGIPVALLLLGAAAAACGDDETNPATPIPDAGTSNPDAGTPTDSGPGADGATGTAPKITTATALPALSAGVAAAPVQLAATGTAPITYAITAGAAPAGMTLSAAGVYAGKPTASGSFSFTVTATNAAGTGTAMFTQMVGAAISDAYVLAADNKLSLASTVNPAGASAPTALTGIVAGDTLVSIDRRPQNGYLYGLGFNSGAGSVQVYAITPSANRAVPIGDPVTYTDAATTGTSIGMDFNPTVDRVRVVTSSGQNFRINPNNGAAAVADTRDGALNEAATPTTGVAETAYTNNTINATATTQYTLTPAKLYIQNPPNNGVLVSGLAIAPAITSVLGFDIAPGINVTTSSDPATGSGFAVVKTAAGSAESIASINLATGALGVIGSLPFTGSKGLTLQKPLATPMVALTGDNTLVRFTDNAPTTVATTATIAGVDAAETLIGIDYRPLTGQLYAIGLDTTAGTGTLYRIDPQSGAASVVGTPSGIAIEGGFGVANTFSMNFNPAVDRIRIVSSAGLNFRVNPDTGTAVDANTVTPEIDPDAALNGGATGLHAVSYTNGPPATGATGITSEYGLDTTTGSLHLFSNPNGGVTGTAVPVKLGGTALAFTAAVLDIPHAVTTAASNSAPAAGSFGYAALTVAGATGLYKIDLVTGAATFVGAIGNGALTIVGLAAGR